MERAIQTIKMLIGRYTASRDTGKYIDVFDDIIDNYNTSIHSSIGTDPLHALMTGMIFPQRKIADGSDSDKLKSGDRVRVKLEIEDDKKQVTFSKGDEPKFSKNLYTVVRPLANGYIY